MVKKIKLLIAREVYACYGRREIELLLEVTGVEHAPGGYRS